MRRTNVRRSLFALAGVLALVPLAARADTPAADFAAAWNAVDNYTSTITVHETDGKTTQDRTYHYAYKKPHFAKIDVTAGPGRGSGAVWTGGDTVKGHQGGLFSGLKLNVSINDGRATSLRGDTIEKGSFQNVADALRAGKVEPAATTVTVDGAVADCVSIEMATPAPGGVTKQTVCLSRTTHMPVRRIAFAGETPVKQEDWTDVKLNPGLTDGDFN